MRLPKKVQERREEMETFFRFPERSKALKGEAHERRDLKEGSTDRGRLKP
jgi:hypothetical protein